MQSLVQLPVSRLVFMTGQPTLPYVPPPEIRPYDQGFWTVAFP